MSYKFALNINDDNQQLHPQDGLDVGDLSDLTGDLKKILNSKKEGKCTLFSIENHGYTPNFITKSEVVYSNFIKVHKDIQEKGISDLSKDEAKYANTLKRILGDDKYIEPIDNNRKSLFRLTSKDIDTVADNYSVITNRSGIISEIGSPKLEDKRHIYLHNVDYKIYISDVQEQILKDNYRNGVVELKLKQRRSSKSGRILNAILISVTRKLDITLSEVFKDFSVDELSIFEGVSGHDDILKLLRS
jgi:hypothetical protein